MTLIEFNLAFHEQQQNYPDIKEEEGNLSDPEEENKQSKPITFVEEIGLPNLLKSHTRSLIEETKEPIQINTASILTQQPQLINPYDQFPIKRSKSDPSDLLAGNQQVEESYELKFISFNEDDYKEITKSYLSGGKLINVNATCITL